jgi:hypothetical protein
MDAYLSEPREEIKTLTDLNKSARIRLRLDGGLAQVY